MDMYEYLLAQKAAIEEAIAAYEAQHRADWEDSHEDRLKALNDQYRHAQYMAKQQEKGSKIYVYFDGTAAKRWLEMQSVSKNTYPGIRPKSSIFDKLNALKKG